MNPTAILDIAHFGSVPCGEGFTHVLIRWAAKNEGDTLKTYWRNISRKAETAFKFLTKAYSEN
jgi:hypothetical protein